MMFSVKCNIDRLDVCKSVGAKCRTCKHYVEEKDYFKAKPKDNKELKEKAKKALEKKGQTILVCQDCGKELQPEDDDELRKTALCPECYDKMDMESSLEPKA